MQLVERSSSSTWRWSRSSLILPFVGVYPVFVMKVLCFALFACAFNLLLGFTGLLSFGHAAFLGGAAYVDRPALKFWGVSTGARPAGRPRRRRGCSAS